MRAPAQIPAIQMGNVRMEILCRNPTHQQHPLMGGDIPWWEVASKSQKPQIGESLLQGMATGRREVPGHPITTPGAATAAEDLGESSPKAAQWR